MKDWILIADVFMNLDQVKIAERSPDNLTLHFGTESDFDPVVPAVLRTELAAMATCAVAWGQSGILPRSEVASEIGLGLVSGKAFDLGQQ